MLEFVIGKVSVTLNRSPSTFKSQVPCCISVNVFTIAKPKPDPSL